jgi:hypothetical protein
MEIEKDELTELIMWLVDTLQALECELTAHRVVAQLLATADIVPELDKIIESARASPPAKLKKRHREIRERVRLTLETANLHRELRAILRGLKPQGPVQ